MRRPVVLWKPSRADRLRILIQRVRLSPPPLATA